ncbi:MAG: SIMPL domain-containing protein [Muribaculaceae bacterium]|nr:SIMPL domain-containing protein [Muribaculaceae bacterium]
MKNYISAALIALGIVILGLCIKAGIDNFSNRDRVVTVRGLCEKDVNANVVTWPIVTKEMGNDLPGIYNKIQQSNNTILDFLHSNGITDDEISINAPDVNDVQANAYNQREQLYRYIVTNVIVVKSEKVDKVNELIKKQTELLKQGIAIVANDYSYPITYDYTELNSIKPEMIAQATRNAREAADKFAQDSDSDLGKIKTASQGQFSIQDRDQYTPYIKTVRIVTYITYYLED